MSDNDNYYEAAIDELQDMLYDADPDQDLADDLAEHASYSPVWQDDPHGELQAYHSDWDYYSDDYYDDDPQLLKQNMEDGNGPRQSLTKGRSKEKRGQKRKHAETVDPKSLKEKERKALIDCIKGTVWATPRHSESNIFVEGQQEKVTLRLSQAALDIPDNVDNKTRGRGLSAQDESWANNLSLADMGLTSERRKSGAQQEASFEEEMADGDEDQNDEENTEEEEEDDDDDGDVDVDELTGKHQDEGECGEERDSEEGDEDMDMLEEGSLLGVAMAETSMTASDASTFAGSGPRSSLRGARSRDEKIAPGRERQDRSRMAERGVSPGLPSPPVSQVSVVTNIPYSGSEPQRNLQEEGTTSDNDEGHKKGRKRHGRSSDIRHEQRVEQSHNDADVAVKKGKKRKLSPAADSRATGSTASSRAKRTATTKLGPKYEDSQKSNSTQRVTRSMKS